VKRRIFFAIELPQVLQSQLTHYTTAGQSQVPSFKWVSSPNFHLTLKFLGNVNDEILHKAKSTLEHEIRELNPFNLTVSHLGAFPAWQHAKVIWLGVEDQKRTCAQIKSVIETSFYQTHCVSQAEKDYTPHITLARLKNKSLSKTRDFPPLPDDLSGIVILVDRVTCFESRLEPKGPLYQSLFKLSLKSDW